MRQQLGAAPSGKYDAVRYGDLPDVFVPADHGLIAWAFDPSNASLTAQPTAGLLQMVKVRILVASTITNVWLYVGTAGATLTAGRNFAALYNSSLGLLSATADQATPWASTGTKSAALTTPQSVAAGDYFVGFYWNGTTAPGFGRGAATTAVNANLASTASRYATSTSGLTTAMPGTAGALTANTNAYWVAVS